jgi:hypothetical protein
MLLDTNSCFSPFLEGISSKTFLVGYILIVLTVSKSSILSSIPRSSPPLVFFPSLEVPELCIILYSVIISSSSFSSSIGYTSSNSVTSSASGTSLLLATSLPRAILSLIGISSAVSTLVSLYSSYYTRLSSSLATIRLS